MNAAVCYDCGRPYGNEHGFPDLVLPHDVWKRISPSGDEGGLLCPSCIVARCVRAGLTDVPASWGSGPLVGVEHTTETFVESHYWCGCRKWARWERCEDDAHLESDDEPPSQHEVPERSAKYIAWLNRDRRSA